MENVELAREFFGNDIYATETTGIEIVETSNGSAKCVLDPDRRHSNASNFVMGGAIFTLADIAFAAAVNTSDTLCVSATSQITFLSPAKLERLEATARCIKNGRRTASGIVDVTQNGELIASVTFTGMKLPKK